ncbi:hypothetical protein WOLCODRAFT_149073 [Wolfiporia cocos MD-104 SS10]|uniref:Uncharacterized protein n=1 Tax=Wolfiporia cocos (strain MD-104) TaxID=742152 RepID=A0A2H3J7B7_WOLCO|nr:hypothetical protein WOLCODRAFT_149073 [Wolfiporia cocos MD-104 SS10]
MLIVNEGTSISVYCIIANTIQYITTHTNLSFTLDRTQYGTYIHDPDPTSDYEYNVTVFSAQALANTDHTLVITPVGIGGQNSSLMLFDWAMYIYESSGYCLKLLRDCLKLLRDQSRNYLIRDGSHTCSHLRA